MKKKWIKIATYTFLALVTAGSLAVILFIDTDGSKTPAQKENTQESAQPDSTPYANNRFVVVLDAGHGGKDGGAVGIETGVKEDAINLSVVMFLRTELTKQGFDVILTRETADALDDDKHTDLAMRKEIMNGSNALAVVSVHMNKFSDRSIHGPMAFYMKGSAEGQRLAEYVIDELCDAIAHPRRFANPGDYYVIRETIPPAVLVECGFLSNATDEENLQNIEYQKKIAYGIANGIVAYSALVNATD